MPDEFMMKHRGAFEGTMKATSMCAKLLLDAMVLSANPEGYVHGSVEHWSSYLQYPPVALSEVEEAIRQLEAPDPRSSTPDEEGRRIVPLGPNRWRIVNYLRYKYVTPQERKRAQHAAAQARYRAREEQP